MLLFAVAGLLYTVFNFVHSGANLAFASMGDTYHDTHVGYVRGSGNYSVAFILYTIFAAPTFIVTVWGLYYFKMLPWPLKIAFLLVTLGNPLIFALSSGAQKTIGDLVTTLEQLHLSEPHKAARC